MTGLRLEAEGDFGRRVVEVAQVLDVEAVVAVGIERPGALEMGRHVVAGRSVERSPSTSALRPSCCGRAMPLPAPPVGISFCAVAFQLGSAAFALPGTEQFQLLPTSCAGGVAAAGVGVAAIEAVFPLRQRGGVAQRACSPASVGSVARVERAGIWPGDHGHRRVLVAGHDGLDAEEQRHVLVGVEILDAAGTGIPGSTASATCCRFGADAAGSRPCGIDGVPSSATVGGRALARDERIGRRRERWRLRPACNCDCRCRRDRPARTSRDPRACRSCRSPSSPASASRWSRPSRWCGCGNRRRRICRAPSPAVAATAGSDGHRRQAPIAAATARAIGFLRET